MAITVWDRHRLVLLNAVNVGTTLSRNLGMLILGYDETTAIRMHDIKTRYFVECPVHAHKSRKCMQQEEAAVVGGQTITKGGRACEIASVPAKNIHVQAVQHGWLENSHRKSEISVPVGMEAAGTHGAMQAKED